MRFSLVLLTALLSGQANAGPKTFESEGVYAANSTISQAPPRSTHALIEPDGDIWAADFYQRMEADSDFIITGEIHVKTGDGIALDYVMNPPVPLSIKTTTTRHTVRFLMTQYVDGASRPPNYYNAPFAQYKPGPFDVDLIRLPRAKLDLRTGSYKTTGYALDFAITFNQDEFSGYNGNCPFTGKVKDGEDKHYKRITLTYTDACYLASSKPFPVLKNSKLEGVVFASKRTDNLSGHPVETDVIVMIMRPKAGQYNLGFSRMFNR